MNEKEIEFPETATVAQLRRLYDEAGIGTDSEIHAEIRMQTGNNVIAEEIRQCDGANTNDAEIQQLNRQIEIAQKQMELNRLKAALNEIETKIERSQAECKQNNKALRYRDARDCKSCCHPRNRCD